MATITPRKSLDGSTTYQVKVRLKGNPATTATFSRLTDARIWASKTETEIRDGRYFTSTEARKRSVADLIDRYLADVLPAKKDTAAPARQLAWWKSRIGHLMLADVTPAVLSEARDALLREPTDWSRAKRKGFTPRSPATVNRYMAAISHAFTVAVREWQWMEFNPMTRISKSKEPRGRVRYLEDDERERFLKSCLESSQPLLYAAVVLSLATGARQGEIMSLQWKDVDLIRGVIILHETKNDERRSVPLTGHALNTIKELRTNHPTVFPWVFPGQGGRKQIDLRAPFVKAMKKAGIEDFRWHDLRHCTASYLAMNGATLPEIAAVLGHKQLDMVRRYAHLSPQHTAGVVARMNEKIFGGK